MGGSTIFTAFSNFNEARGEFGWNVNGDLGQFVQNAKDNKYTGFEVKITSTTKTSVFTSYEKSIGFGISVCIYGVTLGVNGQWAKGEKKLTTTARDFQLIVGAKGWKYFQVSPKNWFNYQATQQYKNGPFVKQPSTPYFGKEGKLSLVPKAIIVIVSPKIDMWVNEYDKNELEKMKSSSMGFSIGYLNIVGLNFNFGKGSTMKTSKETDKLYRVTVDGNSYEPQILLVDYEVV
jgi:hypothetical protein